MVVGSFPAKGAAERGHNHVVVAARRPDRDQRRPGGSRPSVTVQIELCYAPGSALEGRVMGTLRFLLAGLCGLISVGWTEQAEAARRVALVIGNDAYQELPELRKAAGDATSFANLLEEKDFDLVLLRHDLTGQQMNIAVAEFLDAVEPGDTAVFFYSGHGWSDGAQNYLVGIDAPLTGSEVMLARISLPLQNGINGVLDEIGRRGAALKVAIIDACRDNPFQPSVAGRTAGIVRGLARIDAPRGTFVVFSAGTGQTALDRLNDDDPDPNSVFTRTFLPLLRADLPLLEAIKATQERVYEIARGVAHDQEPAYYDQVRGEACLSIECRKNAVGWAGPTESQPSIELSAAYAAAQQLNTVEGWSAFLHHCRDSVFCSLGAAARSKLQSTGPEQVAARPEAALARLEIDPRGQAAPATTEAERECDRLASGLFGDTPPGAIEVEFNTLRAHTTQAVKACRTAAEQAPHMRRFVYMLGRALHAGGEYGEARKWYETAANLGAAAAMFNLGSLYHNGEGLDRDYAAARHWYEEAANLGNPPAMSSLGDLFRTGLGVSTDYVEARGWYEKAANLDYAVAIDRLGSLYIKGWGVEQDYAQGRRLYEKAAALGSAGAMSNIGVLYHLGRGVSQDYNEAIRWYEKAADLGYAEAMRNLGSLYEDGRQDYVEARRWYEKAADLGDANAMHNLGNLYMAGRGVSRDLRRAGAFFVRALEARNAFTISEFQGDARDYEPEVRRAVQRFLIERNYLTGAADGVIGPATRAALDRLAAGN